MHIIVVSDRLSTARTLTITGRHLLAALGAFFGLVLGFSAFFSLLALHHLPEIRLPAVQNVLLSLRAEESARTQAFVQENLTAMAVKLGRLQAELMRLDSLGERLAGLAGVSVPELKAERAGQGGPLTAPTHALTPAELQHRLDRLSRQVESSGDQFDLVETELLDERLRKSFLPTTLPVAAGWDSSSFGWRIDPFTGESALHGGVDFTADRGTAIVAAAGGVVIAAERHPAYGLMIDLDHGNDLTTRYAHASKLLAKPGQLVRRGQKIAEVGSSGRSTGPHLHFEVRVKGKPQNPDRFLQAATAQTLATARR